MIYNKRISLVVPCKNEARIIGGFIRRVPRYVDEIIVVDNNSSDNSARIAMQAGARVVREKRTINGIGYGYAHMRGMTEATGDFIVAMDGDDTYPLSSIKTIIRRMEKESLDVVSCNRLPLKNPKAISVVRQFGIHMLNLLVRLLFDYPIQDILTGMWVVRKNAVGDLRLSQGDWNLSPEIKLSAITNPSIAFAEHHIDHFERVNEISKQNILATGIAHVWYIVSYRLMRLRGIWETAIQGEAV